MSLEFLRNAYEGLGPVLKELTANTTQWRAAQYATMFYEQLGKQIENVAREQHDLIQRASPLREVNEIVDENRFSFIEKYQQIQQAGGEARLVCRIAKLDGATDQIQRKILNKLYRLSKEEIDALIGEENNL